MRVVTFKPKGSIALLRICSTASSTESVARGSDAALEQADVILMHDKIENVEQAFELSRRARSIIRQNVAISLGVICFLLISALADKINLTTGVIGHEGSTVIVILNGLRLLHFRQRRAPSNRAFYHAQCRTKIPAEDLEAILLNS